MRIILLEANKKLGGLGSIVNVKAGYARNYLIPEGKAKFATKENIDFFEREKDKFIAKAGTLLEKAQKRSEEMSGLVCAISANASEEGKLFGSINVTQIITALKEHGHTIEKRQIDLSGEPIRHIGRYQIDIQLHAEIKVAIIIHIVAQH